MYKRIVTAAVLRTSCVFFVVWIPLRYHTSVCKRLSICCRRRCTAGGILTKMRASLSKWQTVKPHLRSHSVSDIVPLCCPFHRYLPLWRGKNKGGILVARTREEVNVKVPSCILFLYTHTHTKKIIHDFFLSSVHHVKVECLFLFYLPKGCTFVFFSFFSFYFVSLSANGSNDRTLDRTLGSSCIQLDQ